MGNLKNELIGLFFIGLLDYLFIGYWIIGLLDYWIIGLFVYSIPYSRYEKLYAHLGVVCW